MTHRSSRRSFLRTASTAAAAAAVGLSTTGVASALEGLSTDRAVGGAVDQLLKLARVSVDRDSAHLLSGFDDTHRVFEDGSAEVLLWPGDLARLVQTGLRFDITVPDLVARDAAQRAASTGRGSVALQPGETASGDYRFLDDYNADMAALAEQYPDLCELITLPFTSLEGRTIFGLEIAEDVARKDGRPVYYNDGIHHAREWPAAEVPIMWAFDLLETYTRVESGESDDLLDRRIHRLVTDTRNVIIPIVNVDGFRFSRGFIEETGEQNPTGVGTLGGNGVEAVSNGFGAYWRKNMRSLVDSEGVYGVLPENPVLTQTPGAVGVDPNRNYSYQWGGDGSSATQVDGTYRGTQPFSEPESNNVRWAHQHYQCVAGITHHTSGDLVLWAWGDTADNAPDDVLLARVGFACGDYNGYQPTKSIDLYVTTGTCSDYTYGTYGSVSYTFEHAGSSFHPPYLDTIPDMYARNRPALALLAEVVCLAPDRRELMRQALADEEGVRERLTGEIISDVGVGYAYDPSSALDLEGLHRSEIRGVVVDADGNPVPHAWVRMTKDFSNFLWFFGDATNPAGEGEEPELIDARIQTDAQGAFTWAVNPTTRPFMEFLHDDPALADDYQNLVGAMESVTLTAGVDPEDDATFSGAYDVTLRRGQVEELTLVVGGQSRPGLPALPVSAVESTPLSSGPFRRMP